MAASKTFSISDAKGNSSFHTLSIRGQYYNFAIFRNILQ